MPPLPAGCNCNSPVSLHQIEQWESWNERDTDLDGNKPPNRDYVWRYAADFGGFQIS